MKQLACGFLLLCTLVSARAQGTGTYEALVNFSNSPSSGIISGTAGWSFTPTVSIAVTDLGCLDYVVTPQGPVDIGLWTDTGTLLGSAVVYATSNLVNQTRYALLSLPVFLNQGSTYRIGAYSPSGSLFLDPVGPGYGGDSTLSSDMTLGALAIGAGGFVFPNSLGANNTMILAANFRYDRIPEPAVGSFLVLASITLTLRKRR